MTSFFSPLEILHVNSKKVACDGVKQDKKKPQNPANSASGHPLVYLDMGKNDFVICPYCSRYFTTQKSTAPIISQKNIKNQNKND